MTASTATVTVSASHPVLAANASSWQSLPDPFPLGPMDHYVSTAVPVQVVFLYAQPSPPARELIPLDRLRRAMEWVLDYYPHLTGRLHVNEQNGERSITRLGTGAGLYEASCPSRLEQFSSPALPGRVSLQRLPAAGNALLAPYDPSLEGVMRDPLFAVQHTRFACGSVALGVRVHHIVADADGYFQFVRDLAEIYRGLLALEMKGPAGELPDLAQPPHFKPYMSELMGGKMAPEEQHSALAFKPSLFFAGPDATPDLEGEAIPEAAAAIEVLPLDPATTTGHFVRYSGAELQALKDAATEPSGDGWVSTFDALSAHTYQCVHRARLQLRAKDPSFGELSPTDILTSVNLRPRLGKDLPQRYFPQAVFAPWVEIPPDVLASCPLWKIAKYVHDMMRAPSTSKAEINSTLRWIAALPNKAKIGSGFRFGSGSFMISQWNKTDMYPGTTFEVRPVLVSPPFTPISLCDGLLYPLPTEDQGTDEDTKAVDVAVALSDPVWEFLIQDGRCMGGLIID
ncbi:hypothetical protein CALVIDRAFT_566597 [Calocera viscosa TUFC12733]|uniref:Transferase family protein n=1 Tax=Calocera viscosa (strain TUFC12733) TaxID=1330018 RepID=A0A167J943_CALVF|nr:hypothetical protein CALVIDRAFT_566597 [Calocera viscosa TUFC12733]